MTRDEFIAAVTPTIRHSATALSGMLAAWGYHAPANAVLAYGVATGVAAVSLAWAYLEKTKLAAPLDALPFSEVMALTDAAQTFRAQGASPLLVAHMVQTAATIANAEAASFAAAAQQSSVAVASPVAVAVPAPAPPVVVSPAPVAQEPTSATTLTDSAPVGDSAGQQIPGRAYTGTPFA